MGFNILDLLLSLAVFLIYGSVCLISLVFTLSLKTYLKIDETMNLDIFSSPAVSPLDINFDWFDIWLKDHNGIIGTILTFFSILILKIWFDIIYLY